MHVMYPEPASQYHSSQAPCQSDYQPATSPAFQQPAKKRRVLSPYQHQPQNGIPHIQLDNTGYKVLCACVMVRTHMVLLLAVALCGAATTLDSELGLGKAINIFMRYGYLSICMRVVPRNDTEGWVFREPTVSVFREVEQYAIAPTPRHAKTLFDGDFHMEFCDNLKQLLQAYFRDFSFERLERPWRAFTAGWPTDIMARNLGINSSFINGDHCYVLVRVSRFRETAKLSDLPGNIGVEIIQPMLPDDE